MTRTSKRRRLLPNRPAPLSAHLAAQVAAAGAGVRAAAEALRGAIDADAARARVDAIEHDGDAHRAQLVAGLARAFTAPLDREDVYRFSRSIDDVLDNVRDFVREWHLYGQPQSEGMTVILGRAEAVLEHLAAAVRSMDRSPQDISAAAVAARKACNQIRYLFQDELAALFERPIDADTLRSRELLRRLDVVGLRLGEAADMLTDAAVKRTLL